MMKKLVIFIWPQFDRDSHCEANFVVRLCHSILRTAFPASTRVRRGITPRIKLIENGAVPVQDIFATQVISVWSSTLPRPEREKTGAIPVLGRRG
jgi:hypothetical protein